MQTGDRVMTPSGAGVLDEETGQVGYWWVVYDPPGIDPEDGAHVIMRTVRVDEIAPLEG